LGSKLLPAGRESAHIDTPIHVMANKLTVEQQLTALESGQTIALGDPAQPGKVLVQASRLGELYYVTGPHFEDYVPAVGLASLFEIGLANGDDHGQVRHLLNQYLSDHGAPATAQLHVCQGLAEALNMLSALVTAHLLLTKR
jgi:hypothetical protein